MAAAAAEGYDLPRREGSDHVTPIDGVTATIMTRLEPTERQATDARLITATDPDFLTAAEIAGRRQALEYARFLRRSGAGLRSERRSSRSGRGSASARRGASTATPG